MVHPAVTTIPGPPPASAVTARCLSVMYHYVQEPEALLAGGVKGLSPAAFAAQVDELCRRFEPIAWRDLDQGLTDWNALPRRGFLLTFDDGLADHVRNVLPILDRRGLKGIFFIPGSILSHPGMLPAHAIHVLLAALGDTELLDGVRIELAKKGVIHQGITEGVERHALRMYHYETPERAILKYVLTVHLPPAIRNDVIRALFFEHIGDPKTWGRRWYLTADELRQMRLAGHTIGGHGYHHEPYARLSSDEKQRDMKLCAEALNDFLDPESRPFSYPYGSVDEETCRLCRDAGFSFAFTTESAWAAPDHAAMRLPRVDTVNVHRFLEGDE